MKNILFALTFAAFAIAAQAGDATGCPFMQGAKSGCCSQASEQVKTSAPAKGSCCSEAKGACEAKTAAKAKPAKAHVLMSPKAAAEVASR